MTDTRFLEAARALLWREGVAAVTPDAVAAEAGVEAAAIEAHFGGRGALLHDLDAFCMARGVVAINEAMLPTTSAEHALDVFLRYCVEVDKGRLEEYRLSMFAKQVIPEMMGPWPPEVTKRQFELGNQMNDPLDAKLVADWGEEMLPHGIHPRRMAFVANLLAQGFLNMKGLMHEAGQALIHSDDDLMDMMANVMSAPPRMIRQLTALNDASRELAGMRSEKELFERVPRMLTEAFDFDRCTLMMAGDELVKESPHVQSCLDEDRTIFVHDPEAVFTPLRCDARPVGVLHAHAHLRWRPMDAQDISRVEAFAAMVGVALQNVRLLENLNTLVDERTRELRNAQARLVQSEKMASLGKLVAGVAHELNTPLGAVSSSRDSMAKGTERIRAILDKEFPQAAEHAKLSRALTVVDRAGESIGAGTARIDNILTRLRSFARLDQAELQSTPVEDCLRDALAHVEPTLGAIVVERELGDTPTIRCYPARLNQVFLNVLSNAVESMDKGTIRVATRATVGEVTVTIADEGHGIAQEHIERIFDPGFTTRGVGVGTGLGLSIAYQIVRDHGGNIAIDSETGRGTTVTITLPT